MGKVQIGDELCEIPRTKWKLQCLHCECPNLRIRQSTTFIPGDGVSMSFMGDEHKMGFGWGFECRCSACDGVTEVSLLHNEVWKTKISLSDDTVYGEFVTLNITKGKEGRY